VAASKRSLHVFDAKSSQRLKTIPVADDINSARLTIYKIDFDGTTIVANTNNGTRQNWTHHRIALDRLKGTGRSTGDSDPALKFMRGRLF
jgi:hypothetical protein